MHALVETDELPGGRLQERHRRKIPNRHCGWNPQRQIGVLEHNSWVIIHCGPQRINGERFDMELETKVIMRDLSVHIVDEIVLVPPLGSAMMRAGNLYHKNCALVNTNTRLVVGWYGDLVARPGPWVDTGRA